MKSTRSRKSPAAGISLGLVLAAMLVSLSTPSAGADQIQASRTIEWERLRPLDHDPSLDSGEPLNRPCVPGETVVMRKSHGKDNASRLGLRRGQFVICTKNIRPREIIVADGTGNVWSVAHDEVNATSGFPANWLAHDRDYLVWAYSRDTIIFRESLGNSYEGNFFYLLLDFAKDGAIAGGLLIDSGTGYADLKPYLLPLIGDKPLTIVSTHSHWDHFGGHRSLAGEENVTLVGYVPRKQYNPYPKPPEYDLDGLKDFFALKNWPHDTADFMLGERKITVIPTPGHTADAIAFYDSREKLLFTNDTLYPGFLFIEDWPSYKDSIARLEYFTQTHPVTWLLGGHVEMSTKNAWSGMHEYFFFGTNTHFRELPPNISPGALSIVRALVAKQFDQSGEATPHYDARVIDREFHAIPYVPVPFPGIPSYYRINAQRLVDQLIERHRIHDSNSVEPSPSNDE